MPDVKRVGKGTEIWLADSAGAGAQFVRLCDARTYNEDQTVPEVDATTFCDDVISYVPGLADGNQITMDLNLRPDHPMQNATTGLQKMIDDLEKREMIVRPGGSTIMYRGPVQVTGLSKSIAGPNELMTRQATLRAGKAVEEAYADPLTLTPTAY